MPGSPILAAHVAEIIRKKNAKEAALKQANAKTATQKASSQAVTDIVNEGIKAAGGGKGSTLSSIKPTKGILSSQPQQAYNPFSNLSPILAKRITERKAVAQRNQGRYAITHGNRNQQTAKTPTQLASSKNVTDLNNIKKESEKLYSQSPLYNNGAYINASDTSAEDATAAKSNVDYILGHNINNKTSDFDPALYVATAAGYNSQTKEYLDSAVKNATGADKINLITAIFYTSGKNQNTMHLESGLTGEQRRYITESLTKSVGGGDLRQGEKALTDYHKQDKLFEIQKKIEDFNAKYPDTPNNKNIRRQFFGTTLEDLKSDPLLYAKAFVMGAKGMGSDLISFMGMANDNAEIHTGNIHKGVIAANKRANEQNYAPDADNPFFTETWEKLKDWQEKYNEDQNDLMSQIHSVGQLTGLQLSMAAGRISAEIPLMAIGGGAGGAKGATGILKALQTLITPLRSPAMIERAMTYAGNRYDEAIAAGADVEKATSAALLYAFPNAYFEALGGADRVASALLKTGLSPQRIFSSIATGAVSEGLEEGAQQVWESGSKRLYGADVPLYANEAGVDAWINPVMIKESAFLGAVLGGLFGGGMTAVNNGLYKLVKSDDISTLDGIESSIKGNLSSGIITRESAEKLLNEVAQAKAGYDVVQSETVADALWKIDGYMSDGVLSEKQGNSLWQVVSVQAADGKNNDIPTSNIATDNQSQNAPVSMDNAEVDIKGIKTEQQSLDGIEVKAANNEDIPPEYTSTKTDGTANQNDGRFFDGENDVETAWNDLKEQYGTWKRGQAPQQINDTQIVSKFVDNALANIEDPAIREALKQRVLEGGLTHERYTDKHAQQDLANDRAILGEDAVNAQMEKDAAILKTVLAKKVVTGQIESLIDAINDGDASAALRVAQVLAETGTNLGQGVQAYSQLKKLTPAGRLLYAQQQLNADYNKKHGYAPEAVKADVEQKVREELPGIIEEILSEYELSYDELAKSFYSEKGLDGLLTKRVQNEDNIPAALRHEIREIVEKEINDRRDKTKNALIGKSSNKLRTKADIATPYGTSNALDSEEGRDALDIRLWRRKKEPVDFRGDGVSVIVNADYFAEQYELLKGQLLERYADNPEAIEYINDLFEDISYKDDIKKSAVKIINQGIRENKINLTEEAKKGNLKEVVLNLTRYAAEGQNLDADGVIDVYAALWEDINGRVIKYRKSVIKNMITKTGKNKKRTYLERLLEYNNIGAFDDPDAAALILNKMDLPFLTQEDFSFITETAEKAQQLPEGSREQQIEYNKINKLINKKKNYTVGQKIRVIQLTDMLLNVRTMERNVVPNVAMVAPNAIGDLFGTVLDKQIAKRTGQRTTGLPANPLDALKDAGTGVANVFRDTKDGIDTSLAGNRDNVPMGDMFSNKNPFGWTVNKASKAVTIGLQLGDRPFEEAYYNNSLRQQMRTNNVSEPTELMKDIARVTAIQRTWKDENIITKGFQFIQHDFLNGGKDFGVGNILLPFIKTPANLLKAIYDYSPAAAASIAVDISKFRKADPGSDAQIMAQFNLVNHTSKALGGTIIMAMAFAFAKAGLIGITGAADDNYEREKYKEEVLGWQPYSIKIGDKYFSYAWTQPFASFMGTGVDLYNNMQNTEYADDGFVDLLAKAFGDTFTMSGKMIYEQTVLQGIYTLFGKDNPWQGLIEVATNAPQQFIPALVGQLATAIDPYKRQTYVPGDIKGNIGRGILSKIPFASKTLPARTNAMGEKLERFPGGAGTDALNAFFNPAQMSQIKGNDVTDEISRLEESMNEKLYPSSAKNAIEVGKETLNLTAKEKQDWNASVGGDFKKAVGKLIESDAYGDMSDSQKAAAISKIHEDLNAIYKYQFLSKKGYDVDLDSAYKKVQEAEKLKISISDFVTIGTSLNVIDNDGKGDFSTRKRDYILNYGLNDEQTIFTLKAHNLISETAIANADDLEEHYGVDQSVFYKAWIECNRIASEYDGAGMSDYRIRKQREYIASLDDLSPEQKSQLDDRIVSDDIYIPNDKLIDYSGGVDSAILSAMSDTAQEAYSSGSKYVSTPISKMGLSASDFSWAYDYMNQADGKKKEDYAKRLNELNLPASTKSAILAARGYKPDYSFNNGGSVEIGSYGDEPKTNEAKAIDDTYTVSSKRNPVEKKRTTFSPLGGDFRISSPWGPREAPIAGASTYHKGIDLAAPEGTPVIAIKNGKITRVSNGGGYGLSVEITFDDGSFAKYNHLKSESVNKGDTVNAGVQIGEVGHSGNATGPHLDFRYKADKDGDWVDPAKYLSFAGNAGATSGEYVPVRSAGSAKETTSSASNGSKSGGIGLRDSHVLASLIAKKHSSYSRYGYGGWPRYSYTGNENKKS